MKRFIRVSIIAVTAFFAVAIFIDPLMIVPVACIALAVIMINEIPENDEDLFLDDIREMMREYMDQ